MRRPSQWVSVEDFGVRAGGPVFDAEDARALDESMRQVIDAVSDAPALADGLCEAALDVVSLPDVVAGQEAEYAARSRLGRVWDFVTGRDKQMTSAIAANRGRLYRANATLVVNLAGQQAATARTLGRVASAVARLADVQAQQAELLRELVADYTWFALEVDRQLKLIGFSIEQVEKRLDFSEWRELLSARERYSEFAGWLGAFLACRDAADYLDLYPIRKDFVGLTTAAMKEPFSLNFREVTTRRTVVHAVVEGTPESLRPWAAMAIARLAGPATAPNWVSVVADALLLATAGRGPLAAGLDALLDLWSLEGFDADAHVSGYEVVEEMCRDWLASSPPLSSSAAPRLDPKSHLPEPRVLSGPKDAPRQVAEAFANALAEVEVRGWQYCYAGDAFNILKAGDVVPHRDWLGRAGLHGYLTPPSIVTDCFKSEAGNYRKGYAISESPSTRSSAVWGFAEDLLAHPFVWNVGPFRFEVVDTRPTGSSVAVKLLRITRAQQSRQP